jgi:hypothetical protein
VQPLTACFIDRPLANVTDFSGISISMSWVSQGNRALLELPPEGFLTPSHVSAKPYSRLERSGHTGKPAFGDIPNVTDGINIPSGDWNPAFGRCLAALIFGKQDRTRLPCWVNQHTFISSF